MAAKLKASRRRQSRPEALDEPTNWESLRFCIFESVVYAYSKAKGSVTPETCCRVKRSQQTQLFFSVGIGRKVCFHESPSPRLAVSVG